MSIKLSSIIGQDYHYVLVTEYDGEHYSTHRIVDFPDAAQVWGSLKDHGNAKEVAKYTMTDPSGNSFTKAYFANAPEVIELV